MEEAGDLNRMCLLRSKRFLLFLAGKRQSNIHCVSQGRVSFNLTQVADQACHLNRLVDLVVKASASTAENPGFESRLPRDFSGSGHSSDWKTGTPVATLSGAWRYIGSALGLVGLVSVYCDWVR